MTTKKQEWLSETDGTNIILKSNATDGEQKSLSIPISEFESALTALMNAASEATVKEMIKQQERGTPMEVSRARASGFRFAVAADKSSAILRVISTAGEFDFVFERNAAIGFTDAAAMIGEALKAPDKMN
ncbi:hypothetical protein [Agrobacterium tumefaciens]|uniref:hypothetical protein n=1 Tax=Agrobacterium tumefaciens TaxID=358 RepID=UPI001CBACA62|nr:hypothetical protein [Agrobacterium tumefaciens]